MSDMTPQMSSILAAAQTALENSNHPVARVELIPGQQVAWDNCCEGIVYLRLQMIYPSGGQGGQGQFPQKDMVQRGLETTCAIPLLAYQLALGTVRCANTPDSEGNAPSAAEITSDGATMFSDISTLLDVIMCAVPQIQGIQRVKVDGYTPIGPEGGCWAGEWSFWVGIDPCVSCEEPQD